MANKDEEKGYSRFEKILIDIAMAIYKRQKKTKKNVN